MTVIEHLGELCGFADGPPLEPPPRLVSEAEDLTATIAAISTDLGRPVRLHPLGVLAERALLAGLTRQGATSCGGASRLVPTAGGEYLVVSLPRADDLDLLPAWLGLDPVPGVTEGLDAVAHAVLGEPAEAVAERGRELGLPVAVVGSEDTRRPPVVVAARSDRARLRTLDGITVVDLTALWAGPLCTRVLADAGATVVKVESTRRPDGARRGQPAFFDLQNAGKSSITVDPTTGAGRQRLHSLLEQADVVVESSRPRALAALGLHPEEVLVRRTRLWVSITGYGRTPPADARVAFGDDAAAAGGCVLTTAAGPVFCADAVADPLAGLHAAAATLRALAEGVGGLLDVSMAAAAAAAAPGAPARPVTDGRPFAVPRPPDRGPAARSGEHNGRDPHRCIP